ncbi:MAG: diguanylate cyclase [Microthrixaceae bacterium]
MTKIGPLSSESEPDEADVDTASVNEVRTGHGSFGLGADNGHAAAGQVRKDQSSEDSDDTEIDLRTNPFAPPRVSETPGHEPADRARGDSAHPADTSTPRPPPFGGQVIETPFGGQVIETTAVDPAEPPAADSASAGETGPAVESLADESASAGEVRPAAEPAADEQPALAELPDGSAPVAGAVAPPVERTVTAQRHQLHPVEPGAVTRSVLRLFTPVLVVLVVGSLVAAAALAYAKSRDAAADEIVTSLSHERSVAADRDAVWSGLLGLVASGVGQEVATPAEVSRLIGRATGNSPGPLPGSVDGSRLLRAADRSHEAFVDSAVLAVQSDGGSPLSIANELSALSAARAAAKADLDDYTSELKSSLDDLKSSSRSWNLVGLSIFVAGLIGAGVMTARARQRATDRFDTPAVAVATAVRRVAEGDDEARSGTSSLAGLGGVAASIDESLDTISLELEGWRSRAEWGERSTMIFEALDEAQNELDAYRVIERALGMVDDDHHPVELLISDRGSNRIRSVANDPTVPTPGSVVVDANIACIAMRRGQVSVFRSSNSINACPMIRDRPDGPCSAVCVPISVGGRPVGVFHMIGPEFRPPGEEIVARLVTLSVQLGNRLSALRALESSRKEASTDGLTGLPNRRMLQSEVLSLIESDTPFVMVLADLDKFKRLNDSYGHEIGDRALKLFSDVLKNNVRGNDVVARIGGEEFVLVYPNMSVKTSMEAIGRLRQALATAVKTSRLPEFTCSFGISDSNAGSDGESILRVADAGLLKAKELGGDQAVYAEAELVEEIFGPGGERERSQDPDRD